MSNIWSAKKIYSVKIICGIVCVLLLSDGPGGKAMSNVSHTYYTCHPLLLPRMKYFLRTGWLCAKLMLKLFYIPAVLNTAVLIGGYISNIQASTKTAKPFFVLEISDILYCCETIDSLFIVVYETSFTYLDSNSNYYGIPPW